MKKLSNLELKTKIIINATALIISTSFLALSSVIGTYFVEIAAKYTITKILCTNYRTSYLL